MTCSLCEGINSNHSCGFSLVELLVVIGVLGVLATFTFALINPKTQIAKANDSTRKSDIIRIQSELEIYRANTDIYPCCGLNFATGAGWALVPDYMEKIPQDPVYGDSCSGPYIYSVPASANGLKYTLFAKLENANDSDAQKIKPAPADLTIGSSSDGYKTFTLNTFCSGVTFNYWINNP